MYDYETGERTSPPMPGMKWLEPTDILDGLINGTDPDHQIAFPGFGYWPRWYADIFRNRSLSTVDTKPSSHNDTERRNSFLCDVVNNLYSGGIVPGKNQLEPKFDPETFGSMGSGATGIMCPPLWDGASCFPATPGGQMSVIPCMAEFKDVYYDTSGNATRGCSMSGDWDSRTDYNNCRAIEIPPIPKPSEDFSVSIYFVGYSLSLLALTLALIIFLSFREMRCLRNKIHTNLFVTFVLSNSCWIGTAVIQHYFLDASVMMCVTHVLLRYFHLTTFFWMFVEGFYLFLQVKFPLNVSGVKLRHYLLIGWALPFMVVLLWSVLTFVFEGQVVSFSNSTDIEFDDYPVNMTSLDYGENEENYYDEGEYNNGSPAHHTQGVTASLSPRCPFVATSDAALNIEWVYKVPVFLLLSCNMVFLIWIMAVVIGKLRSDTSTAESHHLQHLKAAKALLVIIPLLGITYIITIVGPTPEQQGYLIFHHLRAVLLSTQGFVITLPYCFLNTEVRGILTQHWERWKATRGNDGFSRRRSARNSLTMAAFYSTATTDTRYSMNPHGSATPESIALKHSTHLRPDIHRPKALNNGAGIERNSRSPSWSPESRMSSGSNRSNNRNGTVREVYATIHDHDDRHVTTSLIDRQPPHGDRQLAMAHTAADRQLAMAHTADRQLTVPLIERPSSQVSTSSLIVQENNKNSTTTTTNGKKEMSNKINSDVDL